MLIEDRRHNKLMDTPESCRNTLQRGWNGSKAAALKAFCQECIGYENDAIRNCTAPLCPLYEVRPFQTRKR